MEKVVVNVGKTPNGYSASIDILPSWVVGVSGSFDDLKNEIAESITIFIKWAKKDGDKYPAVFDGEYEFEYKFDVESLLYCYEGIFTRTAISRLTGINQKQLGHYARGRSHPRAAQRTKIASALHKLGKELVSVSV
ncbi:MAG: hypothetical protein FWF72_02750 [Paludibacter sp.]|nr:hypothetical protein [Paludibacter sp.]